MKSVVPIIFAACMLAAQDTPLARLKAEAERAKELYTHEHKEDETANALSSMHSRLREWLESRLLTVESPQIGALKNLEASLQQELAAADLAGPDWLTDPNKTQDFDDFGHIGIGFRWLPELPDALFVVAGLTMDCASDQAVYMYSFERGHWQRKIADHPGKAFGFTAATLKISEPDSEARRLLLIYYYSAQCQSTWMAMAYSAFRLDLRGGARQLLSDDHGFWLGNDGPEFLITPNEMMIEFLDRSVDPDVHNRTHILRYDFEQGLKRIDPVAFQPQDFAEEWLTRPWSEMESRSAPGLEQSLEKLRGVSEYIGVAVCTQPGTSLIALTNAPHDSPKFEPLTGFFLVRDLGNYRYRMESASTEMPEGCIDRNVSISQMPPSEKHPWLSPAELRSLLP
jgi:hypothetical protein